VVVFVIMTTDKNPLLQSMMQITKFQHPSPCPGCYTVCGWPVWFCTRWNMDCF